MGLSLVNAKVLISEGFDLISGDHEIDWLTTSSKQQYGSVEVYSVNR